MRSIQDPAIESTNYLTIALGDKGDALALSQHTIGKQEVFNTWIRRQDGEWRRLLKERSVSTEPNMANLTSELERAMLAHHYVFYTNINPELRYAFLTLRNRLRDN